MAANGSLLFGVPLVTDPASARVSLKYDRPLDPVREDRRPERWNERDLAEVYFRLMAVLRYWVSYRR